MYHVTIKASHAPAEVAITTAMKTLLDFTCPSTIKCAIVGWYIDPDGSSAGGGIQAVLEETGSVAPTHTTTNFICELWDDPDGPAALITTGGYDASAEGTITASRILAQRNFRPDQGPLEMWYPEGRMPVIDNSNVCRIRALGVSGSTPNVLVGMFVQPVA